MMDSNKIDKRARAIVLGLRGYSQWDAVSVLAAAISMIASQPVLTGEKHDEPSMAFNSHLLRRRPGQISRIEKDPEIKAFIHSLDRYYPGPDLLALLEQRFGKKRTPSKSSLGRYLQKITRANSVTQEGSE
ncbi:MAG: hypothetical protein HYV06_04350 [Deltaproteobacteria bacterium]|nr:hypothetical protein [Deltaproteobacteria bacterium]